MHGCSHLWITAFLPYFEAFQGVHNKSQYPQPPRLPGATHTQKQTHTHTHTQKHTQTHSQTHSHTQTKKHTPTYTHTHKHTHTHTHIHAYTHTNTHTNTHKHTHTHTHTHKQTNIHIHTRTHTHSQTHSQTHTHSKEHADRLSMATCPQTYTQTKTTNHILSTLFRSTAYIDTFQTFYFSLVSILLEINNVCVVYLCLAAQDFSKDAINNEVAYLFIINSTIVIIIINVISVELH